MRLDGTATVPIALTQLTNTPGVEESGLKFSLDSQTIVCWIGSGASSWIGMIPAAGGTVTLVVDHADTQDYYPSYWQEDRIIYTSWDTAGSGDDDIRIRDLPGGLDVFGVGGFHSVADDSDAFAISPDLLGFSSINGSSDDRWRLWYGNPTTGEVQAFPFHTANKHDLGGVYTPHEVNFVPGPERPELAGDYNFNNVVDVADYVVWRDLLGSTVDLRADGSGPIAGVSDGVVDQHDYDFWKANFGNVLGAGGGASASSAAGELYSPDAAVAELASDTSPDAVGAVLWSASDPVSTPSPLRLRARPDILSGARSRLAPTDSSWSDALIHWLALRTSVEPSDGDATDSPPTVSQDAAEASDSMDAVDHVFDLLGEG
jgi:hypothetical protein